MSKLQIPKKVRIEDFKDEERDMIGKLAFIINNTFDDLYNIINGRIDFSNLNRQLVDVNVIIDSTGKLVSAPQIKTTVMGRVRGLNVIAASGVIANKAVFPITAPFVSFTTNANLLTISNISGLQNSSQYTITLELIAG